MRIFVTNLESNAGIRNIPYNFNFEPITFSIHPSGVCKLHNETVLINNNFHCGLEQVILNGFLQTDLSDLRTCPTSDPFYR